MSWLPPLLVAVPLLAAVVVMGGDHVAPRIVQDVVGAGAAAATCGLGIVLLFETQRHDVVEWFGGWTPRGGIALGIDFVADPLGAGMCALVGGIVLVSLVYSWTFLHERTRLVDVLLLAACGALCGFALSGDIFNLFVWLELAGIAGYALTGFQVRELGPLQGAVNFAIVNTIGGYFVLMGIALVYARTGALNLAQIGETLSRRPPDGLVIVSFTLVVSGFLYKSAVVPFHLWCADAYATAPVPACSMFAGAMTAIGIFGVARVYWTAFDGAFALHREVIGDVFLWLGIVTALLGAVMAFLQRHLKRMLAYTVICHIGIVLAGVGLLTAKSLAGAADLLLAHGLLVAGLFLVVGIVYVRIRTIDELDAFGRAGRGLVAALWFAGALALAGPPYLGVYLGHSLIDDGATQAGRGWVTPLLWLAGAVASGALLRGGARIFLGWGTETDSLLSPEPRGRPPRRRAQPTVMTVLAAVTIVLGMLVSLVPGLGQRTALAAERFRDRAAYVQTVLHAAQPAPFHAPPSSLEPSSWSTVTAALAATLAALAVAAFGLYRTRLRGRLADRSGDVLGPAVAGLKAFHSGLIGDYVVWLTVGTALIGGVWALGLR